MTADELQQYLHEQFPLSKAMKVVVLSIEEDRLLLGAPLAPNINHSGTVFGGSASAVAILAAWGLLHSRLLHAGLSSRVVIQKQCMQYLLPILGTFTVSAFIPSTENWNRFVRALRRRGRARISACATLEYAGKTVGRMEGQFVAFNGDASVAYVEPGDEHVL